MRRGPVVSVVCAVVLAGCTSGGDELLPGPQTRNIQKAIDRGDAAAVAALHVEDAQIIPPDTGEPVKGRAAIEAIWQARIDRGLRAIEFVKENRRGDGEMRFETGTYTSRDAAGEIDVGKYFTVWQEVDGGKWLVSRHTWASDLAEAVAAGEAQAAAETEDEADEPDTGVQPKQPEPEIATE